MVIRDREFEVVEPTKEELSEIDSLEDFDLQEDAIPTYDVWVLGYDANDCITDFSILIDNCYTDILEAKKCYEFFLSKQHLDDFCKINNISIPSDIKYLHLTLERNNVVAESDDTEIIEEDLIS